MQNRLAEDHTTQRILTRLQPAATPQFKGANFYSTLAMLITFNSLLEPVAGAVTAFKSNNVSFVAVSYRDEFLHLIDRFRAGACLIDMNVSAVTFPLQMIQSWGSRDQLQLWSEINRVADNFTMDCLNQLFQTAYDAWTHQADRNLVLMGIGLGAAILVASIGLVVATICIVKHVCDKRHEANANPAAIEPGSNNAQEMNVRVERGYFI